MATTFGQLVSLNFQGTVIVFGRPVGGDDDGIYFNVLGAETQDDDPRLEWSGFVRLDFTRQVRQVGMGIVTLARDATTMVPSDAPFRVVTDQNYVCIVQQSARGTLYVSRFRLLKTRSGTDQKTVSYSLQPAWEVRFSRSGKEDVPADPSDTQQFLDPDGNPFLEPALELAMIDKVKDGAFDVLLLPVAGSTGFAWQFLALDGDTGALRFFNFPASSNGLFDVTAKPIGTDYRIPPDAVCTIVDQQGGAALAPVGPPRAVLYVKHEKVVQPDGSTIGVKRASRVMIALPVDRGGTVTATIDSAVATDGTLAQIDGPVLASTISPAVFDLVFASGAWLSLDVPGGDNPLAVKGPFGLRFLVASAGLADGRRLIGGAGDAAPEKAAPFVRIVDGNKLEIGFGTGDVAVVCRTLHQAVVPGEWAAIEIDYAGKGDDPFTLRVNGSLAPLTRCTAPGEPGGAPIACIGAADNGFAGALAQIEILVGGTSVATLPCQTVDYAPDPPVTPNTAGGSVVAHVHGARNAPSSAPVDVDMSGTFHIDARGITFYAGLADFLRPSAGACLIDGSDGLLHYYYRDDAGLFSVGQFSTASARAGFYAAWSTQWGTGAAAEPREEAFAPGRYMGWEPHRWARVSRTVLVAPDKSQTGFLNFVAQRVGTYMNGTRITVGPSAVSPLLCDVTVEAPEAVGTERWRGLPRAVTQLSRIWNGAGSNSPDAQGVLDQSTPYYDYAGAVPAVLCPTTNAASGSYFLFTSVPLQSLPLASVAVSAAAAGFVTIDVESAAPSHWPDDALLAQHWPDLPADPRSLVDAFAGKSTRYDYAKVTTPGTRAYGLELSMARSDDQVSHLLLFVRDALHDFSITVADGATPASCDVTVCGMLLAGVERAQDRFAVVVNGSSSTYVYPPDYREKVAAFVFALPSGAAAAVVNRTGAAEAAGAFAYAGLLRLVYQGGTYDAPNIAPVAKTSAAVLQGATLTFAGNTTPLSGSLLFGTVLVDPPTDGGVGRLADTSSFSEGQAPVLTLGVNGGWTPVSPGFSLDFGASGKPDWVGFTVDHGFAPAERLAIAGDLTVQCWLKPRQERARLQARALTYNVVGNLDHPDLPVAWMAGAMRGPALVTGATTALTRAFNFTPPAMSVQVYVKYDEDTGSPGLVLTVDEVMGSTRFLALGVNEMLYLELDFLGGAGKLASAAPLASGVWTCVTATVAGAGPGKVTLALYVGDAPPVTATVANDFTGKLGALTVGSTAGDGIAASLNGVAFWQRALTPTEVGDSMAFGFADNDPLLGIRWNLTEGQGATIVNAAATGPEYDTTVVNPVPQSWDPAGAFDVAYAGRNDLVLVSNRIVKGWTNVALASRQGGAVALDGAAFGKVEEGTPFNPGQSLALEAWIAPEAVNTRQVIVEKPGSYSLYINTLGQLVLRVTVSQPADSYLLPPIVFPHEIKAPLTPGKTSYVAVNFTTGSVRDEHGSDQFVPQRYYIYASLFIDGQKVADANRSDLDKAVTVENRESSFFLGMSGDRTFNFRGLVSHVRVWSRTLDATEIARTQALRLTPADRNGLVASWDFDEGEGTVAGDLTGNNNLQLSSNRLWRIWQDVAQASIHVNGAPSLPRRITAVDAGGYGDQPQFTIAGVVASGAVAQPYSGELDDLRLYATLLTGQQIAESMHNRLSGTESNLAGYWSVDAGSGTTLFDTSGRGNNGTLLPASAPPLWTRSSAPIQNEGQSVVNAIGGTPEHQVARIEDQPAVTEFAAAEIDAYGKIFSVMKRGYFYRAAAGETELETNFKVGDLDTIFVGQVQSKPSIVGYIEGGPPIPSENQTLAYWYGDDGGPSWVYSTATSVTYVESSNVVRTFSGVQSSTFEGAFNIAGGFYLKSKSEVSVGVGAEAETQTLETVVKLGAKLSLSGELGGSQGVEQSHSSSVRFSTSMTPSGRWEPADALLNPTVGRRYVQNNIGLALVKSATADMYMLALKGTQTPVAYITVPNETIPVDSNLIDFPINPRYVKNGTLDGKVGLVNDPDYPNANDERGSYFRPLDAYATKRAIEKEEQRLKAYYAQFDIDRYRLVGSLEQVKDKLKSGGFFDFANNVNQRSIYCNYVWSAVGGLHREEHSVANSYSETYVGASSLRFAAGLLGEADIGTPFGGYFIESDVMLGNVWTMTATRAEASSNAFELACTVTPTEFLPAPILATDSEGQLEFKGYGAVAAPGKVDAYRFMSFLLAPAATNFAALSTIIDPNWLANATTASANAMREALTAPSEPWRIFYRTTFVSRVPAAFQPVKDETNAPNIVPPPNLPANRWLVAIIGDQLGTASPTPLEIGTAIDTVLGAPGGPAGLLAELIPWWSGFYAAAQQYGTEDFRELAALRVDLLDYMISKYAAERYALGIE